jgi:HD-like signal output (HDOD) protein
MKTTEGLPKLTLTAASQCAYTSPESQGYTPAQNLAVGREGAMRKFWKRWFTQDAPRARPTFVAGNVAPAVPVALAPDDAALSSAEIEDRFYRLVVGMPESATVEPLPSELAMLKRLNEICGAERFDIESLPRLPAVLPQLLRLLKSEEADGSKLAKLIGRDPVLVGEVMRVTKSAHYRTLKPVASLQHAVVLLGQEGLRRMVTQHVMKPILQAGAGMFGYSAGQRLWDHAERCAHASMFLARGQGDPFEAYLAGVVCNAGVGAMIRVLDREAPPTLGIFSRDFLASCARIGSHLTLRAAQHWELPSNVIHALRERMDVDDRAPVTALGKALVAGDQLAMIQLLAENHLVAHTTPAAHDRVDGLPQAQVDRAQQDLQRSFRVQNDYAD